MIIMIHGQNFFDQSVKKRFKVSEFPFKENKNTLKNIQGLLYAHFYNISLNVLRPNFLNICNSSVSHFQISGKLGSKLAQKLSTFDTL